MDASDLPCADMLIHNLFCSAPCYILMNYTSLIALEDKLKNEENEFV